MLSSAIEVTLWSAILAGASGGSQSFAGFPRESYLAYALWATFIGRITINWMYEFLMMNDIESGGVNALLVRPISFYEFYLSQFVGYKCFSAMISLMIPIAVCLVMHLPFLPSRLPLVLALALYYLIFVHTLSFSVATLAFFMNRAQSFTGVKNLAIWVLAGELIPLDLYPEPIRSWLSHLPFAAGVFVPVGFVTGRIGPDLFWSAFVSVTIGIMVMGTIAAVLWRQGLKVYTGTGA